MNENSEIKKLLEKFVLNNCSSNEIELVVNYFKTNKLTNDFPTVEDVNAVLGEITELDTTKSDNIFSAILKSSSKIETIKLKSKKKFLRRNSAIAASLLILISIGWFYQNTITEKNNKLILSGKEITLQLANGDIQIISEDNTTTVIDADGNTIGTQKGNSIIYNPNAKLEKLVYNTLKIPNGKQFELKLSDGTNVHLNAGTSIKYPVQFIEGQNREVYITGEAFFDVTKDKKHPFVVNADKLNILVLGTHFNVSSYPEDDLTDVVLVEGSVSLSSITESFEIVKNTILKPGEKASFTKISTQISIKNVDPDIYISWMKGSLIFKNMSFKNIITKLERHYDVTITNKNAKLDNEKFSGSFKNQSIAKVLGYFSEIQGFNYTFKDKEITIK